VAKRKPNPKLQEIEAISADVSTLDHYPPISPVGDGSTPFSAAVHWIASKGLQVGMLLSSAGPTYRAAAIALRDKVISGKALTHGENQDGEFEEIPAHEFEELEFTFAESVEDIAGRVNRIDVVPSENGLSLDCFFRARSHRPFWTKLRVRKEDILREWPFDQVSPDSVRPQRGKKPLIKQYLRDNFPNRVPPPSHESRKALKGKIENSELATQHPELKSIDDGTLKTAIDEFNAEFQQS
jgi:hypothetical protein